MKKSGRLAALGVASAGVVTTAVVGVGAPAQAASNPYTPAQACTDSFGGSWSSVSDGSRAVKTASGSTWGTVYLEYNAANSYNCVVTIKSYLVGTKSETGAQIEVDGSSAYVSDQGDYAYYAAKEVYAPSCVKYVGFIYNASGSEGASGGRTTFGNCG